LSPFSLSLSSPHSNHVLISPLSTHTPDSIASMWQAVGLDITKHMTRTIQKDTLTLIPRWRWSAARIAHYFYLPHHLCILVFTLCAYSIEHYGAIWPHFQYLQYSPPPQLCIPCLSFST